MRRSLRKISFSPEAIKWYRRITSFQMTLGLLAILFLIWMKGRQAGQVDVIDQLNYPNDIIVERILPIGDSMLLLTDSSQGLVYQYHIETGSLVVYFECPEASFPVLLKEDLYLLQTDSQTINKKGEKGKVKLNKARDSGKIEAFAFNSKRDIIYQSDGSSWIQIRQADSFDVIDQFKVQTPANEEISGLTDLSYDGNHLYALIQDRSELIQIPLGRFNRGRVTNRWDLSKDGHIQQPVSGIAHKDKQEFYLVSQSSPHVLVVELK